MNQHCLDPFWVIPVEVIVMILLKLPAKYIGRLIFVSRHFSSIICSKDFMELYTTQSLTQPRLLFIYNNFQSRFLESRPQEDPTSGGYHKVNLTLHPSGFRAVSPPIHGLICRQLGTKVMVGNPSTGQFITLPKVKTKRKGLFSFFGYDPVNDVYKVLCMTVRRGKQRYGSPVVSKEHQVFTLGPKQNWRKIACKHPHLPPPRTKGLCINGVVYYYSWINGGEAVLICFDLTSEDFSVVKLLVNLDVETQGPLVNYGGKIALSRQMTMYDLTITMWVLQDAKKHEWSVVSHCPSYYTNFRQMSFEGTLSTGELIYAPCTLSPNDKSYFFLSYNPKDNSTKKVVVQGMESNSLIKFYFDYVDSPMILSNVVAGHFRFQKKVV